MTMPAGVPSARSVPEGPVPGPSGPGRFSPALVMDVELAGPLPAVRPDDRRGRLFVTARLHTEPLGTCLLALGPGGLAASDLADALWPEVREPVMNRFADAGLPPPAPLTAAGLATGPGAWPFLEDRRRALAAAPFISVVICTRDRPESLATCLHRVGQQEYPRFEVLVVDNAPATEEARALVGAWPAPDSAALRPGAAARAVLGPQRRGGRGVRRDRRLPRRRRRARPALAGRARGRVQPGPRYRVRQRRRPARPAGHAGPGMVRGTGRAQQGARLHPGHLRRRRPAEPALPAAPLRGRRQHGLPPGRPGRHRGV